MDPCRGRRPITPDQGQCVDGTKVLPIPWSPFVGTTGRELKGAAGAESPVPAKALAAAERSGELAAPLGEDREQRQGAVKRAVDVGARLTAIGPEKEVVVHGHLGDDAVLEHDREAALRELRECHASLSRREREVMVLVIAGLLNKQVGGELGISEITVKSHRGQVMRKMKADSLADLVSMGAKLQLAPAGRHRRHRAVE